MRTADFDYDLPDHLIAYYPEKNRVKSRLIVLNRRESSIAHKKFFNLADYLKKGDLLVLNNTKVIPARLKGYSKLRDTVLDIVLVKKIDNNSWAVLLKRPKEGLIIKFKDGIEGEIFKGNDNSWRIRFNRSVDNVLWDIGDMPLPPYIKREAEQIDKTTYQTVYAEKEGAIAAPTAGLHFDENYLKELSNKGIQFEYITLHIGIGTFRPVKVEDIAKHKMHSEFIDVPERVCRSINKARSEGRRVIAVGTTVVRALESAKSENGQIRSTSGQTALFIKAPYNFKFVDGMITNFHLPRSTLLMLVCAFADKDFVLRSYKEAIMEKYRFLSYGDSMLII